MSRTTVAEVAEKSPVARLEEAEQPGVAVSQELAEEARKWTRPQPKPRPPEEPQRGVSAPRVEFDLD